MRHIDQIVELNANFVDIELLYRKIILIFTI